jgi:hypothetical protein
MWLKDLLLSEIWDRAGARDGEAGTSMYGSDGQLVGIR